MENLKPIKVNVGARIIGGMCGGLVGKVIEADWEEKKITLRVDSTTVVTTEWTNVEQ